MQAAAGPAGAGQERLAGQAAAVGRAVQQEARDLDKAARALTALESSLGGAYRAHAQMIQAEERLDQAVRAGLVSKQRAIELQQAMTTTFTAAAVGSRDLRTNMAGMRGALANAGQQLQDLAIVASMGSRAFGQIGIQVAQMASGFGPWGVAIGTVIGVLSAAAGALFSFSSAADEATAAVDALDTAFSSSGDTIDDTIEKYRELTSAQLETERVANLVAGVKLDEAILRQEEAAETALQSIENLNKGIKELFGVPLALGRPFFQLDLPPEQQAALEDILATYRETGLVSEELITKTAMLRVEMGVNAPDAIRTFVDELLNAFTELEKLSGAQDRARERMELANATTLAGASTTKENVDVVKSLTSAFDEAAKVQESVTDARKAAAVSAQRDGARLADQRAETVAGLKTEISQMGDLLVAYRQDADAIKKVEVATEAANIVRRLKLEEDSEEARLITALVTERRAHIDSLDDEKQAIADRDRQAAASAGLTATLEEQLSLQRLLLSGIDKESEHYRIHVALLQAKRQAGGELTAQQESLVRQLERQSTVIDQQTEAREKAKRQAEEAEKLAFEPFKNALESIQSLTTETFETIYSGGIKTFGDLADAIKSIFIRLAAEISSLMIFRAATMSSTGLFGVGGGLAQTLGLSAAAAGGTAAAAPALGGGIAGWQTGLIGGAGAFSRVPGPGRAPTTAGLPGTAGFAALNQPWWRPGALGGAGLFTAGALGFAGGGLLGGLTGSSTGGQFGGAAGALLGGLTPFGPLGALAGGIGGGLLGGALGGLFGGGPTGNEVDIGGGFGAAAGGTGEAAKFVQQLDKQLVELLDARSRRLVDAALRRAPSVSVKYGDEGPSANDLARLTAGRIAPAARALGFRPAAFRGLTGEQAVGRLGEAIQLKQQIKDLTSGFGNFASQARTLKRQFEDMTESAKEFGISTRGLPAAQRKAGFDLIRQQLVNLGGVTPALWQQLRALDEQFNDVRKAAGEFGFSIKEVGEARRAARSALRQQVTLERQSAKAQLDALRSGSDLKAQIIAIRQQFAEARRTAEAYGFSTRGLAEAQRRAVRDLREAEKMQRQSVKAQLDALRAGSDFEVQLLAIKQQFTEARRAAEQYGLSTRGLAAAQRRAIREVKEAEKDQRRIAEAQVKSLISGEFANQLANLNQQFRDAEKLAREFGISTKGLAAAQRDAVRALKAQQRAQIDAMAISIVSPFDELSDPLKAFKKELDLALLQPAGQYRTAAEDFRRIANEAAAGSTVAIQQLTGAGQLFVQEAGRFGASPAQVAAIQEVASTIENVLSQIDRARADASRGLQDEIKRASDRQVDKLSELVSEVRLVGAEIRRLRG